MKAALHRGRGALRALAAEPAEPVLPVLSSAEQSRLVAYVERFNARDFDRVRDMLAEDVRLELVNRLRLQGKSEVGAYFHRYAEADFWRSCRGWSMAGWRRWSAIATIRNRRHAISCCSIGRANG